MSRRRVGSATQAKEGKGRSTWAAHEGSPLPCAAHVDQQVKPLLFLRRRSVTAAILFVAAQRGRSARGTQAKEGKLRSTWAAHGSAETRTLAASVCHSCRPTCTTHSTQAALPSSAFLPSATSGAGGRLNAVKEGEDRVTWAAHDGAWAPGVRCVPSM